MRLPALYTVQLLKTFKCDDGNVYREGSWQYCWVDMTGFMWLRGWRTGWEFCSCAHPGVDFRWHHNEDPRTPEEVEKYRARFG